MPDNDALLNSNQTCLNCGKVGHFATVCTGQRVQRLESCAVTPSYDLDESIESPSAMETEDNHQWRTNPPL